MKKLILTAAVAGMVLGAANAFAAAPYVSIGAGVSLLSDSTIEGVNFEMNNTSVQYENGYMLRGAFGTALNKSFRLELEGFYTHNDTDSATLIGLANVEANKGGTTAMGMLVNGYYDINFGSRFVPFLSAGLGFANLNVDFLRNGSQDQNVFAYTIGAGAAYAITDKINLELAYRYLKTEDTEFDNLSVSYGSHQIMFNTRFSF
jgi:outer membrane immunogenic protein